MTMTRGCPCCDATPEAVVSGAIHDPKCPLFLAAEATRELAQAHELEQRIRARRARLAKRAQAKGASLADLAGPFGMSRQGVRAEIKAVT